MRTTAFQWRQPAARALVLVVGLGSLGFAACDDASGLGDSFLIRSPERRPGVSAPVSFTVSPSDTSSILFEWAPAPSASSYTITFWRGESEAQVESLEADFSSPFLSWEVDSPQVEEVLLNPENPNDDRSVTLVRYRVPESDVAAQLQSAGVTPGSQVYTLFSVFAHRGTERWRSPSLHPLLLILAAE